MLQYYKPAGQVRTYAISINVELRNHVNRLFKTVRPGQLFILAHGRRKFFSINQSTCVFVYGIKEKIYFAYVAQRSDEISVSTCESKIWMSELVRRVRDIYFEAKVWAFQVVNLQKVHFGVSCSNLGLQFSNFVLRLFNLALQLFMCAPQQLRGCSW